MPNAARYSPRSTGYYPLQRVREAVVARRENLSPEYLRIYQNNMNVIFNAITQLLNGRSEQQDQYLREKLLDVRKDFQTLIAQGKVQADSPPD